ncbi:hypothetical protein N656DRAFT_793797 [Canariomyces notabilis]|uniref:DUF4187 domain-containing protein n=1 Tax=Canariomyces notabilis TaxID=2074819 RepID=A0AAN6TML8_9PEZI|nr:hypothetical protein N656DRAFT_793797 [Canariomyces arenarius]
MAPQSDSKPRQQQTQQAQHTEEEEEEEDYMTMNFADDPATGISSSISTSRGPRVGETSLQRHQRLRREAEARARPKSKAELAAEAEARREEALSRSLMAARPQSKGLAMMAKMGFTPGSALGRRSGPGSLSSQKRAEEEGAPSAEPGVTTSSKDDDGGRTGGGGGDGPVTEPLRIAIKDGREGIGLESERKRKLREAAEAAGERAKRARADETEYRERLRREREEARWAGQLAAAQKVAERMAAAAAGDDAGLRDGEGNDVGTTTSLVGETAARPLLKSIPVEWRGLVRAREEAERDRRMRYDLEQGLASRLPTYEDPEEDEDDKRALGKTARTMYVTADDLDEEDPELDEFEALPVDERLRRVVEFLRERHNYCFWCKFAYPDKEMDGCPGMTEEDHD